MSSVTFSTCWYSLKSKFPKEIYLKWADNMLSNVNHYYLVIYCDEESSLYFQKYLKNPNIRIVNKSFEDFYNYKYKDKWISNHEKNNLLRESVDWKVNMLWSEKIHFVYETMENNYFNTDFFGWCDIGYFRGTGRDMSNEELKNWCSSSVISKLEKDKIYYALVNNNEAYILKHYNRINNKNEFGLPKIPTPDFQVSIAGGFFISHKNNIEWWRKTYDNKLCLYFQHNYLVKDDQHIILDCVFSNLSRFYLCRENINYYDNWFMFQRILSE